MDLPYQVSLLSVAPTDAFAFAEWLKAQDAVRLLHTDISSSEMVLYANMPNTFINTVAVPSANVSSEWISDIDNWNVNAYSGWGVLVSFDPVEAEICPPLQHTGSSILDGAEQLIFARTFEAYTGDKHYYEFLQKFIQISQVHYVNERNAYCRFDTHGDIEDVIRFVRINSARSSFGGIVITCKRDILDAYLLLTRSVLTRMFDFTRFREDSFSGWGQSNPIYYRTPEFYYRQVVVEGYASYLRGVQILHPVGSRELMLRNFDPSFVPAREYASFITYDWFHGRVAEVSSAPSATRNYFTESDLPFEVSPVFFRAEVLAKYKADSGKYQLDERTITCRDTWYLQSYDINEAGQVHTYIVYLRNLPYAEQLYWKAFNEVPKGDISNRARLADFEGSWNSPYDALESIKNWVRGQTAQRCGWWKLRGEHLSEKVRYSVTASADEWANEILHLDQLIIEGFETTWLRQQAVFLERNPQANMQSLKLLKECLLGKGMSAEVAEEAVLPLQQLHFLRTKLKGHAASTTTIEEIRLRAIQDYSSYDLHFRSLCQQCDESLKLITGTLKNEKGDSKGSA